MGPTRTAALTQGRSRTRRYREGATILAESGDAAAAEFRVLAGLVRLVRHTEDGRRCVLDFRFPGQGFGRAGEGRLFAAEAATECVVEKGPGVATGPAGRDAEPPLLERIAGLATMLACRSATERVAQFLLDVQLRMAAGPAFALPMARQDVADHLGIRAETLCRCLSHLAQEGLIAMWPGQVLEIRDPRALRMATQEGRRRASADGNVVPLTSVKTRRGGRRLHAGTPPRRHTTLTGAPHEPGNHPGAAGARTPVRA